ncbi:hypothetical protein [Microbacterium sp. BK668]|uniref:hypothetical protein n=1 Tax=Microbacterium sp. BK668 TaxID=2512118 RepID=UPI001062285D|nr:hypothetical protein [Microbacterium sp. BK668]TDN92239.1 hypothetical protein EV279_1757 [Microbacterium sp. BK668]
MDISTLARRTLLVVQGFVAATAVAGGIVLVLASVSPAMATVLSPPPEYLEGSPFASYLVPGLALALVLGGIHIAAFVAVLRRVPGNLIVAAAAAFAALIWIFVQMIFIPFSFLQAVYFGAGLLEAGLTMVLLGLLAPFGAAPAPAAATAGSSTRAAG